jgi:hypothetical protein
MSGRQTTQFANSRQETICPVTRQPFCTFGATRSCFAMHEHSTSRNSVFPGDLVGPALRSLCVVTDPEKFVVVPLSQSGSSNPVQPSDARHPNLKMKRLQEAFILDNDADFMS